jgi:hypothetical protein
MMLALAIPSGSARAAEPEAPEVIDSTTIESDLHSYYGGERSSAYIAAGLGAASAGVGGVLVTRDSDFARGMGWPLLGLGAIELIGGIGYAISVNAEIDHYAELLHRDPVAFQREEVAHIRGTTSRFVFYRLTEFAFLAAGTGIAIYGFASDKDAWKGAGIGIAAFALPLVVIDTINDARAHRYLRDLEQMRPTIQLGAGPQGIRGFVLAGRF